MVTRRNPGPSSSRAKSLPLRFSGHDGSRSLLPYSFISFSKRLRCLALIFLQEQTPKKLRSDRVPESLGQPKLPKRPQALPSPSSFHPKPGQASQFPTPTSEDVVVVVERALCCFPGPPLPGYLRKRPLLRRPQFPHLEMKVTNRFPEIGKTLVLN